jgi:hypothetical protein
MPAAKTDPPPAQAGTPPLGEEERAGPSVRGARSLTLRFVPPYARVRARQRSCGAAGAEPALTRKRGEKRPAGARAERSELTNAYPHRVHNPRQTPSGDRECEAPRGLSRARLGFRPAQEQPHDDAGGEELNADRHTSGPVPAGDTMRRVELLPAQPRQRQDMLEVGR